MGYKLLLADDSITIQKVVGIIFANEDYELTIVDNGDAALTKASEVKPDVMLVDAIMPGKNGYEVCEAVRSHPGLQGTPLLLLTGAFEPFDEDQAKASGADDFISKPFESQHLIEKVKKLLEAGKNRPAPVTAAAPAAPEPAAQPAESLWEEPSAPTESAAAATPDLADMFAFEEISDTGTDIATGAVATEEVTAASGDDLWGTFEVEEVTEETSEAVVELGAPPATEDYDAFSFADLDDTPAATVTVTQEEEAFSFVEEEETAATLQATAAAGEDVDVFSFAEEETAPSAPAVSQPESSVWGSVEEQAFSFAEEPATDPFAPSEQFSPPEETPEPEHFGFSTEPAQASQQAPAPPSPSPAPPAAAPEVREGVAAPMTITEDQLTAMVAKISKEIIEKIAWEVVPDLAEALIKEEIRKIKDGK